MKQYQACETEQPHKQTVGPDPFIIAAGFFQIELYCKHAITL